MMESIWIYGMTSLRSRKRLDLEASKICQGESSGGTTNRETGDGNPMGQHVTNVAVEIQSGVVVTYGGSNQTG